MIAINAEFTGEAYRQIMEFCFLKSDAVSLTYHNYGMPFKRNIRDIRKSLRPYRISSSCNLRKQFRIGGQPLVSGGQGGTAF